jgi:hypothetical protein
MSNLYDEWYSKPCDNCDGDRRTCGCIRVGCEEEPYISFKQYSDLKQSLAETQAKLDKAIAIVEGQIEFMLDANPPTIAQATNRLIDERNKLKELCNSERLKELKGE